MKPVSMLNERLIFGFNWEKPRDWRDGAVNLKDWRAWDKAKREACGFWAGLSFWKPTNVPNRYTILSRHWPHRLCWDWSVSIGLTRPLYDGKRRVSFVLAREYRSLSVSLIFFDFHASWQNYQYMGALGPAGRGVPEIIWAHHLEHVEPAGNA